MDPSESVHNSSSASSADHSNCPPRVDRFIESNEDGFHLGALKPSPVMHALENVPDSSIPLNDLVQEALVKAREKAVDTAEASDDPAIVAAIAYSLEQPPLYRKFNEVVRKGLVMELNFYENLIENFQNLLSYMPIYKPLHSMEATLPALPDSVILYRGCGVAFRARVGQTVSLTTFTSTSTNAMLADIFAGPTGTLIHFTGPLITGLDMKPLSNFPEEEEVLLFPLQTFRVQSIEKCDQQTVITLYSLKETAVKTFIERNQYFPPDSTPYLMYSVALPQSEHLYLQSHDLVRFGYLPPLPEELPHINHLPAYDIILRIDVKSPISSTIIILNIAAIRDKYTKAKTVYWKYISSDFSDDDDTRATCSISAMPAIDAKSLLESTEQADPTNTATSFIFSKSLTTYNDQLVYDLMPAQYHHLVKVKWVPYIDEFDQIQCKVDTTLFIIFSILSFLFCLCPLRPSQKKKHHHWLTTERMLALARAHRLTSQAKAFRSFIASSPPQPITEPKASIFITTLLLFRYAQLKFPNELEYLTMRLRIVFDPPNCTICGKREPSKCPCSKSI